MYKFGGWRLWWQIHCQKLKLHMKSMYLFQYFAGFKFTFGKKTVYSSYIFLKKYIKCAHFTENDLHFMQNCIRLHYEKLKHLKSCFIENSNFESNRDPCTDNEVKRCQKNFGSKTCLDERITSVHLKKKLFSCKEDGCRVKMKESTCSPTSSLSIRE